jgi:hypothetical protein
MHLLSLISSAVIIFGITGTLAAAADIPLRNWSAPAIWQPAAEGRSIVANADLTHGMPFFAVTPCRVYDSRVVAGGPGPIAGATSRTIDVDGGPCGPIPTGVGAYSVNITVFGSAPGSSYAFITAYPTGSTRPTVSTLNFLLGTQTSNAAIVPAGTAGDIDVYASSTTEIVIDINGYYTNSMNPGRSFTVNVNNEVAIQGISGSSWGLHGSSGSSHGVAGISSGSSTVAGVYGFSANGRGVFGLSTNYNGVWAQSTNQDGLFAFGGRDGGYLTGTRYGVFGNSSGAAWSRAGVLGTAAAAPGTGETSGVRGISPTLPGGGLGGWIVSGVSGYSTFGFGVNGVSEVIGVQGAIVNTSGSVLATGRLAYVTGGVNYGVYSQGPAHIAGTLSKSGGSFKIDHPVDPENKTLSHSFVESPDMKNIYDGNVTLDRGGRAVVQLPDYFQALNRDFRYQLTAIGKPGPNLYIEQEIHGNQFVIAGGNAGMRVSWMVTGIRQDAWAERFRIPVEEFKREEDRGYYLNPEAFDLPAEKSITARDDERASRPLERIR